MAQGAQRSFSWNTGFYLLERLDVLSTWIISGVPLNGWLMPNSSMDQWMIKKIRVPPDFGNIWWSIPFSWLNFQGWRFHQHRGNQTWFHDEKQSTRKGIWVILSIPCRYSKFFFSTMMWLGFLAIVYDPNWPQFLRGFKPASHWNWVLSWFQKRLRIPHSFSTVRPLLQIDWEWVWVYWVPWRNHIVVYCNRHFLPHLMDIVNVSGKPGASTIYLR